MLRTLLLVAAANLTCALAYAKPAPSFAPHLQATSAQEGRSCARKPGADVMISGREFFNLQPGQMTTLAVDLVAPQGGTWKIQVQPEEKGLLWLGQEKEFLLNYAGQTTQSLSLPIRALSDGQWVINLLVSEAGATNSQASRALALVVQVGNAVVNNGQQKPSLDEQGQSLVVLPAQEVIQ